MARSPARARRPLPFEAGDLRGLTRLGFDAAIGVTGLVEAMHGTIASGAGIVGRGSTERTAGLTRLVYRGVRGTMRTTGRSVDAVMGALLPAAGRGAPVAQREAMLAALNGVWGDHLAVTGNPLAIESRLRVAGRPFEIDSVPGAARRVVVLVHGLCMNDLQWMRNGHDHGQALARDLGFTPVWFHYNSGRHVSQNGRDLARHLQGLVSAWPAPLEEVVLIGHSMGGLVVRSAAHCAGEEGQSWIGLLRRMVLLGTPHHGAPLERGGQLVDTLFGMSPYVAPFARLGKARSAGILDLRFGNLQDADWQGRDRHAQTRDDRCPTPLPVGVRTYLVGATRSAHTHGLRNAFVGDGLVPLPSALGEHRDPARTLTVPRTRKLVVHGAGHWDLLDSAEVYTALHEWLR